MIVAALNELLAEKLDGVEWIEKPAQELPKCKKHPKYQVIKPPRVKKGQSGCICHQLWDSKQAQKPEYEPVLRDPEKMLSSEVVHEVIRQLYKFPDELKTEEEERSFISASKAGQCVYKLCLDKLGCKPEPLSARTKLTFMFGGLLEAVYRYLLRTCEFEGFRFIEVPQVQPVIVGGEKQRGYYDGVIEAHWTLLHKAVGGSDKFWKDVVKEVGREHIRVLWEMKTKSDYSFKKAMRGGTDPEKGIVSGIDNSFGYLSQKGYYLRQAYEDGIIDVPLGVWFLVNKNTGAPGEVWVALKQLEPYMKKADENYQIVAGVVRENKPLPPRPFSISKDGNIPRYPCGYCDQKWNCWSDEPVDHYERVDMENEHIRWRPVWKSEPTIWLEVDFDKKGQPVFLVMEKGD